MLKRGHSPFFIFNAFILIFFTLPSFWHAQPPVETTLLYDGALGGTPDTQHFSYLSLSESATQTFMGGVTTLDTTAVQGDQAGYFSTDHPALDRQLGYSIIFTLQLLEEAHASYHRAGFSLTALGSDVQGIELGFWSSEIWAQEGGTDALFTHAESASFNTTAALTTFELAIRGDEYVLYADGLQILSGSLRDYTALESLIDPYETPNLLFLGDNTSRGQAKVNIAYVAVQTVAAATSTPSPTTTATAAFTPTATSTATAAPSPTMAATLSATPIPQPERDWNWWFPLTAGYPPP